ncbi:hypothetical protein APSETT445_004241 [Aspergillus pseudonomiae]
MVDWVEHKAKCKQLQARKSLSRAANLLQAILYRIRLRAHGVTSATAHVDGSRVILCPAKEEQEEVYRPLGPLCVELMSGDQRAFDAIVMNNPTDLVRLPESSADCTGLCSKIEELTIDVRNPEISIERPDGVSLTTTKNHNVYRVTLKSGEIWVIDPSGAQYGFVECLYTWRDFAKDRLGGIHREDKLGYQRVETSRDHTEHSEFCLQVFDMELLELASALDEKIPTLAKVCGGDLKLILQGSGTAFQKAKNELLDQLGRCVDLCLEEVFSPERIVERSMLADRRIARKI